jgi:hypothetical protein
MLLVFTCDTEQFHGYEDHVGYKCFFMYVITLITNSYIDYLSIYDYAKDN